MRGDDYTKNYPKGYTSWASMKNRCNNTNRSNYAKYGGAGINYDLRWESFANFLADMGERPDGTTLDRIDNTGWYTKTNCRWATPKVQATNRNNTVYVTNPHTGAVYTIAELAKMLGVSHTAAYKMNMRGKIIFKQKTKPDKEAANGN